MALQVSRVIYKSIQAPVNLSVDCQLILLQGFFLYSTFLELYKHLCKLGFV